MRSFKYNIGKKKNGLYADINGIGQAYSVLLFLQTYKRLTGIISFSKHRTPKSIKFVKDKPGEKFDQYYIPEIKVTDFRGVHFQTWATRAKKIYVTVTPSKR